MNDLAMVPSKCSIALLACLCALDASLAQTARKVPLRPPLTSGTVQDNTYRNESLGLQFTPPLGLKLSAPELKGEPGTVPLLVTVAAWSDPNTPSASGGAIFYADDLGYYPEARRSTNAYVARVVRNQNKEGLELVGRETEAQLGGVIFARVDFHQTLSYEAVLVKACDFYAFVFIFAASDLESANRLVAQTTVKLDAKNSGCRATTSRSSRVEPCGRSGYSSTQVLGNRKTGQVDIGPQTKWHPAILSVVMITPEVMASNHPVTLGKDQGGYFVAYSRSNLWFAAPERKNSVTTENASELWKCYGRIYPRNRSTPPNPGKYCKVPLVKYLVKNVRAQSTGSHGSSLKPSVKSPVLLNPTDADIYGRQRFPNSQWIWLSKMNAGSRHANPNSSRGTTF